MEPATQQKIKEALGKHAADLVEDGMLVGLGTGSTASCFINSLIERCRQGLRITAVSSSIRSLEQAKQGGIPLADMDHITSIDLTVDGADEIDPQHRLIKGGGGAHVREKILATTSKKILIIADEDKLVSVLGKCGLPVEILPFGFSATLSKIHNLGYNGALRMQNNAIFVTDNGNYLYDIHTPHCFKNPEKDHADLIALTGVVETGFFFNLPLRVLIGYKEESTVKVRFHE